MSRDIDQIIERVKQRVPDAEVWQLRVNNPRADDDGLWFFTVPDAAPARHGPKTIQIESSYGTCPFLVEHSDMTSTSEAETARTVEEAVEKVVAYLRRVRAG